MSSQVSPTVLLLNLLRSVMQVRTEYGVLPTDHPKRTEAQLDSAIAMLETGNLTDCAESVLKPMMEQNDQVESLYSSL